MAKDPSGDRAALLVEPPLDRGCCIITSTSSTHKEWTGLRAQDRIAHRAQHNRPLTRLFRTMTWSAFADQAIEHVLRNRGSRTPGPDGKTRSDYMTPEARLSWRRQIIRTLRSGTYRPSPVRRTYIDKPHKPGEKRPLGIPTLTDKVGQALLKLVLEPVFESRFHPHSYGFRPFRSAHHAVQRVRRLIQDGYTWVIEGDIAKFFDRVDHNILLQLVQREIGDRRILRLIRAFLKAGILEDGTFSVTAEGTPQGGILSPLLGNIYLNELDWYVARKYETIPTAYARAKQPYGCFICRCADDFVILVRGTREDAKALKAEVALFLREALRLELSPEKTLVTHVDAGFDFLGFHIRRYQRGGRRAILATPSKKAQTTFRRRIRDLTKGSERHDGNLWILDLNAYLAGWAEYYRRGNSKLTFSKLDHTLWWMIALRMRGRWRRSRTKGGFGQFIRERLIPYRYDAQQPHYHKYMFAADLPSSRPSSTKVLTSCAKSLSIIPTPQVPISNLPSAKAGKASRRITPDPLYIHTDGDSRITLPERIQ